MPSLFELQQQFAAGLNHQDNAVLQYIQNSNNLSAQDHLAIYQSSARGALQNALKEVYPVCLKLVGEDFFLAMVNQFITETPSLSPDLAHYGAHLADFIIHFPAANSVPYLADTARLEWAWHCIFSCADSTQLDFQQLASCYNEEGGNIIFSLPNDGFLLSSPYPIHQIWEMNQANYQGPDELLLTENLHYFFLIWRHGFNMRIDVVTEIEWKIMNWMQAKLTLGQICTRLHAEFPNASIAEILPKFVSRNWLTGFSIQSADLTST